MTQSISVEEFRAAMGRFPGAVTIVTASNGVDRFGITATAVSSVSSEPPSLLVCLNKSTGTCNVVQQTGAFNVNLLTEGESDLAMRFAGAHGVTGDEKFLQGEWTSDARGLPLLHSSAVSLCCEVMESVSASSHMIFIGKIMDVKIGAGQPLLYAQSGFRGLSQRAA